MAWFSNLAYVLQVPEDLTLSEVVKSLPKEVKKQTGSLRAFGVMSCCAQRQSTTCSNCGPDETDFCMSHLFSCSRFSKSMTSKPGRLWLSPLLLWLLDMLPLQYHHGIFIHLSMHILELRWLAFLLSAMMLDTILSPRINLSMTLSGQWCLCHWCTHSNPGESSTTLIMRIPTSTCVNLCFPRELWVGDL